MDAGSIYMTAMPVMTKELRALGSPDLHLTLCYFPGAAGNAEAAQDLRDHLIASSNQSPIEANVDGVAMFSTPKGRLMVLLVRSVALDALRLGCRDAVRDHELTDGEGLGLGAAHMTLWPVPDDQSALDLPDLLLPATVVFNRLSLHVGGEIIDVPMRNPSAVL